MHVCVCVIVCVLKHYNYPSNYIAVVEVRSRGSNTVLIVGGVLGALVLILLLMLVVSFILKCRQIKCLLQGKPDASSK